MTKVEKDSTAATIEFPDDVSCWLCLEEGPDESGKPLVRDCSCRGSSGVAHIACIIGYAESESRQIYEREGPAKCIIPFHDCPSCKQPYQNDVRKDLAKAAVKFVESEFWGDSFRSFPHEFLRMNILMNRVDTLQNEEDAADANEIAEKFISACDRSKMKLDVAGEGLRLREESRVFKLLAANGYATIGSFYRKIEGGQMRAIEFFEKARDVFKTMHTTDAELGLTAIGKIISDINSELSGNVGNAKTATYGVKFLRQKYLKGINLFGEKDPMVIGMGVELVYGLKVELRAIEAERFARKLVEISSRTHGADHGSTKNALLALQDITTRQIAIRLPDFSAAFQALRYENDGEKCVVQGPLAFPRQTEEEHECVFDSIDIILVPGTPVVCHSLQKAAHLNGKIGEVRDVDMKEKEDGSKYFDKDTDRCVVHFEDKSLKPVRVKAANLRVVFDLPAATAVDN